MAENLLSKRNKPKFSHERYLHVFDDKRNRPAPKQFAAKTVHRQIVVAKKYPTH